MSKPCEHVTSDLSSNRDGNVNSISQSTKEVTPKMLGQNFDENIPEALKKEKATKKLVQEYYSRMLKA